MFAAIWSVLLELSPWLLLGLGIAGLLHGLVPQSIIQRHFKGQMGVVKAVALGVPIPLCSCSVIPAGIGLKKEGASDGAAVGFLISTPQTGVDSVLVSAAMLGWPFAIFKVLAALFLGIVGGSLTERLSSSTQQVQLKMAGKERRRPSWREMLAHAIDILRSIWRWMALGVLISAALSYGLGGFQFNFGAMGVVVATLAALAVAVPLYVCATASVPIAAALLQVGMPTGAALVFLMAGPATNVATIGAIHRSFGRRALWIYLSTIVVGSIVLALAFEWVVASSIPVGLAHHEHSTWWAQASAAALLLLFAYFSYEEISRWFAQWRAKRAKKEATMEQVFKVQGMTCSGCSNRLAKVLQGLEGVEGVEVKLEAGEAHVFGQQAKPEDIEQAIRMAGFEVLPVAGSKG